MKLRNYDNYPVDTLPPRIKKAVQEWYANTEFPTPLIVASAFGAVSAACQNSVDVGSRSALSMYLISVADPDAGKSPKERVMLKQATLRGKK